MIRVLPCPCFVAVGIESERNQGDQRSWSSLIWSTSRNAVSRSSIPPSEYRAADPGFTTERELVDVVRKEDLDLAYVVRSSHDDWDTYEAGNWDGLLLWLDENPDHPERGDVIRHLHKIQDEYAGYVREYMGWAVYVLASKCG